MNNLTVLRHLMGCDQNVPTEVPEKSKSPNTFSSN